METTLIDSKRKITDWVNSLEDESLLNKIMEMMKDNKLVDDEKKLLLSMNLQKKLLVMNC